MSKVSIKDNVVAVDHTYFWQAMASCPRGVKVQLLGNSGVPVYAVYDGRDDFWRAWAPLPTLPKELK